MPKITYIGPLRGLPGAPGDVELGDQPGTWATAGEPIEVDAELAEQLLEQQGNWARAHTKAAKEVADENGGK